MIPYHELRIGNYVLAGKQHRQISMIDQRSLKAAMTLTDKSESNGEYTFESILPVKLTDDVLKQCGFFYHDYFKFWQLTNGKDGDRSEMDIDPEYNLLDFMRKAVVKKITSLHQLQNIYFILKGKELVVKKMEPAT